MTVKRHPEKDDTIQEFQWGGKTLTWRTAVLLLLVSTTPAGDKLWTMAGYPRDQEGGSKLERRMEKLEENINAKLDAQHEQTQRMNNRLMGLTMDFTKYKLAHP